MTRSPQSPERSQFRRPSAGQFPAPNTCSLGRDLEKLALGITTSVSPRPPAWDQSAASSTHPPESTPQHTPPTQPLRGKAAPAGTWRWASTLRACGYKGLQEAQLPANPGQDSPEPGSVRSAFLHHLGFPFRALPHRPPRTALTARVWRGAAVTAGPGPPAAGLGQQRASPEAGRAAAPGGPGHAGHVSVGSRRTHPRGLRAPGFPSAGLQPTRGPGWVRPPPRSRRGPRPAPGNQTSTRPGAAPRGPGRPTSASQANRSSPARAAPAPDGRPAPPRPAPAVGEERGRRAGTEEDPPPRPPSPRRRRRKVLTAGPGATSRGRRASRRGCRSEPHRAPGDPAAPAARAPSLPRAPARRAPPAPQPRPEPRGRAGEPGPPAPRLAAQDGAGRRESSSFRSQLPAAPGHSGGPGPGPVLPRPASAPLRAAPVRDPVPEETPLARPARSAPAPRPRPAPPAARPAAPTAAPARPPAARPPGRPTHPMSQSMAARGPPPDTLGPQPAAAAAGSKHSLAHSHTRAASAAGSDAPRAACRET